MTNKQAYFTLPSKNIIQYNPRAYIYYDPIWNTPYLMQLDDRTDLERLRDAGNATINFAQTVGNFIKKELDLDAIIADLIKKPITTTIDISKRIGLKSILTKGAKKLPIINIFFDIFREYQVDSTLETHAEQIKELKSTIDTVLKTGKITVANVEKIQKLCKSLEGCDRKLNELTLDVDKSKSKIEKMQKEVSALQDKEERKAALETFNQLGQTIGQIVALKDPQLGNRITVAVKAGTQAYDAIATLASLGKTASLYACLGPTAVLVQAGFTLYSLFAQANDNPSEISMLYNQVELLRQEQQQLHNTIHARFNQLMALQEHHHQEICQQLFDLKNGQKELAELAKKHHQELKLDLKNIKNLIISRFAALYNDELEELIANEKLFADPKTSYAAYTKTLKDLSHWGTTKSRSVNVVGNPSPKEDNYSFSADELLNHLASENLEETHCYLQWFIHANYGIKVPGKDIVNIGVWWRAADAYMRIRQINEIQPLDKQLPENHKDNFVKPLLQVGSDFRKYIYKLQQQPKIITDALKKYQQAIQQLENYKYEAIPQEIFIEIDGQLLLLKRLTQFIFNQAYYYDDYCNLLFDANRHSLLSLPGSQALKQLLNESAASNKDYSIQSLLTETNHAIYFAEQYFTEKSKSAEDYPFIYLMTEKLKAFSRLKYETSAVPGNVSYVAKQIIGFFYQTDTSTATVADPDFAYNSFKWAKAINSEELEIKCPQIHAYLGLPFAKAIVSIDSAFVNQSDTSGRTLLHYAVQGGASQTIQALLEQGADINAADDEGYTSLHSVALYQYEQLLPLFLDADMMRQNQYGDVPIDLISDSNFREKFKVFMVENAQRAAQLWSSTYEEINSVEEVSTVARQAKYEIIKQDSYPRANANATNVTAITYTIIIKENDREVFRDSLTLRTPQNTPVSLGNSHDVYFHGNLLIWAVGIRELRLNAKPNTAYNQLNVKAFDTKRWQVRWSQQFSQYIVAGAMETMRIYNSQTALVLKQLRAIKILDPISGNLLCNDIIIPCLTDVYRRERDAFRYQFIIQINWIW